MEQSRFKRVTAPREFGRTPHEKETLIWYWREGQWEGVCGHGGRADRGGWSRERGRCHGDRARGDELEDFFAARTGADDGDAPDRRHDHWHRPVWGAGRGCGECG